MTRSLTDRRFWLLASGLLAGTVMGLIFLVPDFIAARGDQRFLEEETRTPLLIGVEQKEPTGEEAKKALMEMINQEKCEKGWSTYLRDAPIEKDDPDTIYLGGRFVCNLKRATFIWYRVLIKKGITHAHDIILRGVFERTRNSRWRAKITQEDHRWH